MARRNGSAPGFFKELVEDPTYKENLKTRLHAGILAPNLEMRVLEYVYGKPAEEIDLNVNRNYAKKSPEELMEIATRVRERLKQLFELTKTTTDAQ